MRSRAPTIQLNKVPIPLDPDQGPVVFFGTMNAMPMMYALELRRLGIDVLYFVDVPSTDTLSRPECHFSEITYPYPSWIIELKHFRQKYLMLAPRLITSWLRALIARYAVHAPQAFVLDGLFISLATRFSITGIPIVALPHGSDLDSWADIERYRDLSTAFEPKTRLVKLLPRISLTYLIKRTVFSQFAGLLKCTAVLYYPIGFNLRGDAVVKALIKQGVVYIPRYDISFEPLKDEPTAVVHSRQNLVLFSGVRFLFKSFHDGNHGYNKGNDIIIRGIALFHERHPEIPLNIHFVTKGPDVELAKELCAACGIADHITWHAEMPFRELLNLYQLADVCFDQVGQHWVGAIGFYALALGKPLIANDELAVRSKIWNSTSPILTAKTPSDVAGRLEQVCDPRTRIRIAMNSRDFAKRECGPIRVVSRVFSVSAVAKRKSTTSQDAA